MHREEKTQSLEPTGIADCVLLRLRVAAGGLYKRSKHKEAVETRGCCGEKKGHPYLRDHGIGASKPRYPRELNYPITPKQICESAVESAKAGASVVHLHVRPFDR